MSEPRCNCGHVRGEHPPSAATCLPYDGSVCRCQWFRAVRPVQGLARFAQTLAFPGVVKGGAK